MIKSNLIISPCGIANLGFKRFSVFLSFLVHLCESRRVRVFHMLRNNRTAIVFSKIGVSHFRFGEVSQVGVFSLDLPGIVFHKFRDTDSVGLSSFATKLDYAGIVCARVVKWCC